MLKVLTKNQKELQVSRGQELLNLIKNELNFLNSVVVRNESCMFEYDPESKRQELRIVHEIILPPLENMNEQGLQ